MGYKVGVAFGGPSPEHEISILTGLQCERVLAAAGCEVIPLYWDTQGRWFRAPAGTEARDWLAGPPQSSSAIEARISQAPGFYQRRGVRSPRLEMDAIMSCFHGGSGEGGGGQALFQLLGYPATGGTVASAALGMDKLAFAGLMAAAGIPTLPRALVSDELRLSSSGPFIVKPRFGGSSLGIERVRDLASAQSLVRSGATEYAEGAVIEPFRSDLFDLNISYCTAPQFALSDIEKPLLTDSEHFYTYEDKYTSGQGLTSAPREIPANIPAELAARIRELTIEVARVLGYHGIARLDFLSDGVNELYVNEVNTIPGAMALYLWRDRDPEDLLMATLEEAMFDYRASRVNITTISGDALRAAGGISGKLERMLHR